MSAEEKTLSLRWLTVVIVVIAAGMVLWVHYRSRSVDPKTRQYTAPQWLQMATQSEHQPIAVWRGIPPGRIGENGAGFSFGGLDFRPTPATVLEYQAGAMGLLKERPLLFLPLFDSQSPQVVLVAVYAYTRFLPRDLSEEDASKIAEAFRKLLGHEDARLRFTAIEVLAEKEWLTAEDIIGGLGDKAQCVRIAAAWKVYKLTENPAEIVYDANDRLVRGDPNRISELLEIKRKLAPVLLEHLNDTHFYLRHQIASEFKRLFKKHVQTQRGFSVGPPPYFPEPFGWLREDWESRHRMQEQWKQWWQQHGEEALRWAHPPQ